MTIAGQETVAELRDLVKAKDYTIKQIDDSRKSFKWTGNDASDWDSDWTALKIRYGMARTLAQEAFGRAAANPITPDELIPAPVEWDAVIKSIRKDPNVQSKGDLQDLHNRLLAAGKSTDFSNMPQPGKQADADLNIMNKIPKPPPPPPGGYLPWIAGGLGAILLIKIIK